MTSLAYNFGSDYVENYNRGWATAGRPTTSLDNLDARNAKSAEYDGYLDRAAGRVKWSLPWSRHIFGVHPANLDGVDSAWLDQFLAARGHRIG